MRWRGTRRFGVAAQALLRDIRSGRHTVLTSHFLLAELLVAPVKAGDTFRAASYRRMFTAAPVEVVPFTAEVAVNFAALRAKFRTKAADSIHLALAEYGGADVFVSGDGGLKRVMGTGIGEVVDLGYRLP